MKILHVITSLHFGGAEKLLFETIPLQIKKGIIPAIYLINPEQTHFKSVLEKEYQVKIYASKKKYWIYNPLHVLELKKIFSDYDIIHSHIFPSLYWVAFAHMLAKKDNKLLVTEHSTNNRRRNLSVFKYIDRFIYAKFDAIIAISDATFFNLKRYLGESFDCITIIFNGINLNVIKKAKAYSKKELNLPANSKVIIKVSRFYFPKDQATVIRGISKLPDDYHLLLVGDGSLRAESESLCEELSVANRVHFLGFRTDVPRLMKTADICVLSSSYEGFGLAIVEGMAAGIPCIGTNVGGLSF